MRAWDLLDGTSLQCRWKPFSLALYVRQSQGYSRFLAMCYNCNFGLLLWVLISFLLKFGLRSACAVELPFLACDVGWFMVV